jgi:phosphatidate cytidylyltransferase
MSQLKKRLLIALWGIPLLMAVVWFGGVVLALFIAGVCFLGSRELGNLVGLKGWWVIFCAFLGAIIPLIAHFHPDFVSFFILLSALAMLMIIPNMGVSSAHSRMTYAFAGLIYPSLMLSCLVLIRDKFTVSSAGAIFLLYIMSTIWICDTAAYAGGKTCGRHKLAPTVSPNKTWEGAIFGLLGGIIWSCLCYFIVTPTLTIWECIGGGVIVGTIGQIGDLAESVLKRSAGVKDTSSLLGPHGGVLDRFDSLIAVAPAVYGYLKILGKM